MQAMRCFALLCAGTVAAACQDGSSAGSALDAELSALIQAHELTGDPSIGIETPDIAEPLPVLGKRLFFSKTLGGDLDTACVSCHHPVLGGGDGLPLSIGVGAEEPDLVGPGRTHPEGKLTVPRNAPTTFNVALWRGSLFWDSRVEAISGTDAAAPIRTPDSDFGFADPNAGQSLSAAQARFPVTSPEEMRGFDFVAGGTNDELRDALVARLEEARAWGSEFEAAFGTDDIDFARIAAAIAAYEESQVFVDTPWRAYVEGDTSALTDSAKRGALLFFETEAEGGAGCASCHSGDFFTDERHWALGAPQIGHGKGDGSTGTNDAGRARESGDSNDRYAFRTPSLLNVTVTGPYFHSGVYATLEEAIRHHLDPRAANAEYDVSRISDAYMDHYATNMSEIGQYLSEGGPKVVGWYAKPLSLSENQVDDLVAFMEALTDPCTQSRSCLEAWIANPETDDPDGNLLVAMDGNGNLL